jgi:hypothetical protein
MTNTFLWNRWAVRLGSTALVLTLAFAPLGCKRKAKVRVQTTEEEAPRMASTVSMGDPRSEPQLVSGFYTIEQNSWRWTARQFTVVLRPPFSAAEKGAVLKMRLTVPDPVIAKLKTVSLAASINGHTLPPETYTKPGQYTYTRDVPASLLAGESTKVEFQLDKAMPPGGGGDMRELGIVALSIGLEPK